MSCAEGGDTASALLLGSCAADEQRGTTVLHLTASLRVQSTWTWSQQMFQTATTVARAMLF